ncbi:hypothetical protein KAR91_75030 [Candidatus Pacearchaeota archaeon]|nr:hypothetical protein [Candidatus Pacearchaeota archaeon]
MMTFKKINYFLRKSKWFQKPPPGYQRLTSMNVKKMTYDQKRGFSAMLEHPALAIFTIEIIKYFKAAGGVNFVSFCAWDSDMGEIEITVRPKSGKTKAQIISELKKEIEDLKTHKNPK